MTDEQRQQIEQRAEELSSELKCKVHIYASEDDEPVVAYFREPNFIQKLCAMDKIATVGPFIAADELRKSLTIKEASDERCFEPGEDKYLLGLTGAILPVIEVAQNAFKKK